MKRARHSGPSPRGARAPRAYVPRKTMYELPPLELECMKALWQQEEASVRQIREHLAARLRPLAYTTVETIMDRLTRKGAVARRKLGKAHRYTPVYQKAEAREQAVAALAEHFFDGSRQALRAHLEGAPYAEARRSVRVPTSTSVASSPPRASAVPPVAGVPARVERPTRAREAKAAPPLDTTLL